MDLLEALKGILEALTGADLFIVGIDSNVPGSEMIAFQKRLSESGMDFGYSPAAEQATVAKVRTMFQTQVLKATETDVSHKHHISDGVERLFET